MTQVEEDDWEAKWSEASAIATLRDGGKAFGSEAPASSLGRVVSFAESKSSADADSAAVGRRSGSHNEQSQQVRQKGRGRFSFGANGVGSSRMYSDAVHSRRDNREDDDTWSNGSRERSRRSSKNHPIPQPRSTGQSSRPSSRKEDQSAPAQATDVGVTSRMEADAEASDEPTSRSKDKDKLDGATDSEDDWETSPMVSLMARLDLGGMKADKMEQEPVWGDSRGREAFSLRDERNGSSTLQSYSRSRRRSADGHGDGDSPESQWTQEDMRTVPHGGEHALEAYGISFSVRTRDLESMLRQHSSDMAAAAQASLPDSSSASCSTAVARHPPSRLAPLPADIRWVDDEHALLVFMEPSAAEGFLAWHKDQAEGLFPLYPVRRLRPDSPIFSKLKRRDFDPPKARPRTSALAAQRMIAGASDRATAQAIRAAAAAASGYQSSGAVRKAQDEERRRRLEERRRLKTEAWGEDED